MDDIGTSIKLSPWIYGNLVIIDKLPVIVDSNGKGKIAIIAEAYINNAWKKVNLIDLRENNK